jgi:F0F1-type ATP synthase assembly protein I
MMWGQLAIKALVSGVLIAAASEIARRSPGWGGLIASLPLVSLLAMLWLWRDGANGARIADFAISSTAYVIASLPAFVALAVALRRGVAFPIAITLFVTVGFAGYLAMIWLGKRWGLPV